MRPISCYYYACDLSYFDVVLTHLNAQISSTDPINARWLRSLGFPKSPPIKKILDPPMVGLGRGSTVVGNASLRRRASTMTWTRPDFEHISQQVGVPRQLDGRLADEAVRWTDEQRSEHSRHGRRRHLVDVASPRHAL